MHTDLNENVIARRLRGAGDESSDAPYDWAEFQRRRHRSALTRVIERHRPIAIAAAVLATVFVTAAPFLRRTPARAPVLTRPAIASRADVSGGQDQARTRAIEGWLARLPHDRVIVRVGTHAAVTSLQDQIAALDDLMSTERVAGAQPTRLDALEQQRTQLVSSLAQLQYAEMLASASP
jgi:hypothetical protein